jgi:DinB superfamily
MSVDWTKLLAGQLEFYWDAHLRPRLDGLTDEEYLWEPVEGAWNLRRGEDGSYAVEHVSPAPSPPPVTTIAWRIVHIGAYVLYNRANAFFGDNTVPADAVMFDPRYLPDRLPGTADEAIAFLDDAYRRWHDGIISLDEAALAEPLGPKGGPFSDEPMAGLVLHISREVMHHGGEICLLRDLYRATGAKCRDSYLVPRD